MHHESILSTTMQAAEARFWASGLATTATVWAYARITVFL